MEKEPRIKHVFAALIAVAVGLPGLVRSGIDRRAQRRGKLIRLAAALPAGVLALT